jgi:lauroyl/myristoyl acyltransferase
MIGIQCPADAAVSATPAAYRPRHSLLWWNSARECAADLHAIVYHFFLWSISLLPLNLAFKCVSWISKFKQSLRRQDASDLRREIAGALDIGAQEREELIKRTRALAFWDDVEALYYNRLNEASIHRLIWVRGLENLDRALQVGRGAIVCCGHFRGLFGFLVALNLLGYKLNAIRRAPKNAQGPIARWLNRRRTLISTEECKFLWMKPGNLGIVLQAERGLKRNEIVIMLIDARFATEAVEARFLNKAVPLPSGHVVLAHASGAPVLTCSVHSSEHGLPRIAEIGEPYFLKGDVVASVQNSINHMEKQIRKYPADWVWFADRGLWDGSTRDRHTQAQPSRAPVNLTK